MAAIAAAMPAAAALSIAGTVASGMHAGYGEYLARKDYNDSYNDPYVRWQAMESFQRSVYERLGSYLRQNIGKEAKGFDPGPEGWVPDWEPSQEEAYRIAQERASLAQAGEKAPWQVAAEGLVDPMSVGEAREEMQPIFDDEWKNISAQTKEQYAKYGTASGSPMAEGMIRARGSAEADQTRAAMDYSAQSRQQALQGMQFAMASADKPQRLANIAAAMGEERRGLEMQEIQMAFQEFMRVQPEYSPLLQLAMQYMGIDTGTYINEPGTAGQISPWAAAVQRTGNDFQQYWSGQGNTGGGGSYGGGPEQGGSGGGGNGNYMEAAQ